jgi:hypothetical protein
MPYTTNINGVSRTVEVDGDTPLLWVLRDRWRRGAHSSAAGRIRLMPSRKKVVPRVIGIAALQFCFGEIGAPQSSVS